MDILNWSIQISPVGVKRMIVSEYVLNDMGIFIKDEYRMPKKDVLTTITGFRVGYNNIPNTDYHAAPGIRNAILWHKITDITEDEQDNFTIKGNSDDVIKMVLYQEDREQILNYISQKQKQHPTVIDADKSVAAWMCWRDDEEWEDPYASLRVMIQEEIGVDRFVEDVIEDTVLKNIENVSIDRYIQRAATQEPTNQETLQPVLSPKKSTQQEPISGQSVNKRPIFCSKCGERLSLEGSFCHNCGAPIS